MLKAKSLIVLVSIITFSGNANADFWSRARDKVIKETSRVATQVTGVVAKAVTTLNIVNCDKKKIHGIDLYCFNSSEQKKISQSLDTLKKHPFLIKFASKNLNAYKEVTGKTKQIGNFDSKTARVMFPQSFISGCSNDSSTYGCHSTGSTFIAAQGLKLDRVRMSGFLLHEVGHHGGRMHNCGNAADKDTSGPYGLEAFYFMGQFHNGLNNLVLGKYWIDDVSFGEGLTALSRAMSIAQYQMCGNKASLTQIMAYVPSSTTK